MKEVFWADAGVIDRSSLGIIGGSLSELPQSEKPTMKVKAASRV
jgi:hypothetical protein